MRNLILFPLFAGLVASLLFCCGDKNASKKVENASANPPGPVPKAPIENPVETAEQKFARQQSETIDALCPRMVDCMLEDAKANMSAEEYAKIEASMPGFRPKLQADCMDKYGQGNMSPRQVVGIRECLTQGAACQAFGDCVYAALKPE